MRKARERGGRALLPFRTFAPSLLSLSPPTSLPNSPSAAAAAATAPARTPAVVAAVAARPPSARARPKRAAPVRVCVRGAVRQLLSRVRRVNSVRGKGDNSEAVEGKQFV